MVLDYRDDFGRGIAYFPFYCNQFGRFLLTLKGLLAIFNRFYGDQPLVDYWSHIARLGTLSPPRDLRSIHTLFDGLSKPVKRRGMQKISVPTSRREELVDITSSVENAVGKSGISSGLCVLYCPHTTAGITVNEGADPSVAQDMVMGLQKLIPGDWNFSHMEGNSDAHIKASLIGPSETVIVDDGRIVLGTWQRVFFCEFDGPRKRVFFVKIQGREETG
jgi:secondary thiamine-phosphate synthase enzyme